MSNTPFFSIVIPTFNEEKFLPQLLQDLSDQTEKAFEVIVVDGNSEDKTFAEAQKFKKKLALKIIKSSKRNLSFQRNLGAQKASGSYIIFIDSDMKLGSDYLENVHTSIKRSKHLIYLPIHMPYDGTPSDSVLFQVLSVFVEISQLSMKPFTYGPSAIFERNFFFTLGGYDEKAFVFEDHELIQRARARGVKAELLSKITVYFSFRRFKKEGRVAVLSKYLVAVIHLLVKGKVDKEIFQYEMGGSAKYLLKKPAATDLKVQVQKHLENLKRLLD